MISQFVKDTARRINNAFNLDANESLFFARELERIKAKSYDILFPELLTKQFVPVDSSAGPGAESITYYQFTKVGIAVIISNYADDLPRSDAFGKKFTIPVEGIGGSWGISLQEIRASNMVPGRNVLQRKGNSARQAFETKVDNVGFSGDTVTGLTGFANNPNVPVTTLTNGAGGFPEWNTKTPAEILADMTAIYAATAVATKDVEKPESLLLPSEAYSHISTTPRSTTSDTTILQFFLKNYPLLKFVAPWWKLNDAGAGGVGRAILYTRNPDKVTFDIPQPYEQLPAQHRNLEMVTPTHGRVAGVTFYYPLSARYIDKIA
jgi:hypothetical protein